MLALIPARGGSKGLPRKNLLPVGGLPLLAHNILAAQAAPSITEVAVTSDDAEILAVARRFQATAIERPAAFASDTASSESALLHALDVVEARDGQLPDYTVFLQCTSPLTLSEDIEGTVQALREHAADSAFAGTPFFHFIWRPDAVGGVDGLNHDKRVRQRRQERAPEYLETGAVYAFTTEGFRAHKHRFFGKTVCHPMPAERVWEIDEPVDLDIADTLLRAQQQSDRAALLPDPVDALIMDFDGVFTDNAVQVSQEGVESVRCSRGDGMGLEQLRKAGLPLMVISKERNPVVLTRCNKLKIDCLHGVEDKWPLLEGELKRRNLRPEHTLYVGNDINDLECLQRVGCGIVVADAHPSVLGSARIHLSERGGYGALREVADLLLKRFPQGFSRST